ncbi:MAG: M20 family metallopeptidase [Caldilineaceae bacterium]|nr:M20 family metallopeptidase [Caldilineaceae bacterium]
MDYPRTVTYFDDHAGEMLDLIRALVTQETPSDDKPRLDAFADFLADRFRAIGAAVEIIPATVRGNHLVIRVGHDRFPDRAAVKQALVLCHYDTVWPVGSLETHPFRVEEDGKAYGPGIFDMQSSLMLAEFALRAVRDLDFDLPRPVTILINSDEEVGSASSRELIEAEGRQSAYVLVMESPLPGGVIKTARKGGGNFTVEITGRAAHAGVEPEKGISAIHEMAHQIMAIQGLTDWELGTTVNVGVVNGGTKTNVIPAKATAKVDMRAWTQDEVARVTAAMRALEPVLPGAHITVTGAPNRPPLERAVTVDLFARTREIGRKLGLELEEGATGGGSDGNWTAALGIPTLDGLGVPGHGAHADHEHIETDKIAGRAALLTALLMEL